MLWVKDPSPVAKEWPLSTFLIWPRSDSFIFKFYEYLMLVQCFVIPDAVNGPDVMFGQNTSVSRLAIFPEDAGSDRPMDGENKGIPIGHRNVITDDVNHPDSISVTTKDTIDQVSRIIYLARAGC